MTTDSGPVHDAGSGGTRLSWPGEPLPMPAPDEDASPFDVGRLGEPGPEREAPERFGAEFADPDEEPTPLAAVSTAATDVDAVDPGPGDGTVLAVLLQIQEEMRQDMKEIRAALRRLSAQGRKSETELVSLGREVATLVAEHSEHASVVASVVAEVRGELRVVREELHGVRRRMPVTPRRTADKNTS